MALADAWIPACAEMTTSTLDALRQFNRQPATSFDGLAQQLVARRLFGPLLQGLFAMGRFVGAEILDRGFQRRIFVLQRRDLRGIMLVDDFLDRGGAGKGRFL